MRQVSILIAALCCLALVAHQSAADDETRVKAKDKGEAWTEGSVWEGIGKYRTADGREGSTSATYEITKRDGKSFEGRMTAGVVITEFEGEVDITGKITLTTTKIVSAPDEWKKGAGRNFVGRKESGLIDGKQITLKGTRHDPDNPKGPATHFTNKLKLKEEN